MNCVVLMLIMIDNKCYDFKWVVHLCVLFRSDCTEVSAALRSVEWERVVFGLTGDHYFDSDK